MFSKSLDLDNLTESDANVIFYVAGYIGRSVARQFKCCDCKMLLVTDDSFIEECPDTIIPSGSKQLFEMANRGGLAQPSDLCFLISAFGYLAYNVVCEHDKSRFLLEKHHRLIFVKAVSDFVKRTSSDDICVSMRCVSEHSVIEPVLTRMYNCLAKNELKRMNAKEDLSASVTQKCRKLQSDS